MAKFKMIAVVAAAILAVGVSTSHAESLGVSENDVRVVYEELTLFSFSRYIVCELTLEGSLHSNPVAKVAQALIGHITRATVGEDDCEGWTDFAQVLEQTLPWHITYLEFEGALPNIEALFLAITGVSFRLVGFPIGDCLWEGTLHAEAIPWEEGTFLFADEESTFGLAEGDIFCWATLRASGLADITELGSTTPLVITLV